MGGNHSAAADEQKRRHKHEGPRKHVVAFVFSLVLTLIAFSLVIAGDINTTFIYIMLVVMAIAQVFIQMAFWMHMKDRGHVYATIGILTGVFIILTMVVMAIYWVWW